MKYIALLLTLITVSAFADGFIASTGGSVTDGSSITNIQYTNIVGVGVTPLAATNQGNTYNGSFEGPALSLADTNRLIVIIPYYKTINSNTNQIFTNYLGNYYRPGGYNAADFYLKKIGAYWVFTCDSYTAAADRTNYSKNITGVYELGLNEGASLKYGALVQYAPRTNFIGDGGGLTNIYYTNVTVSKIPVVWGGPLDFNYFDYSSGNMTFAPTKGVAQGGLLSYSMASFGNSTGSKLVTAYALTATNSGALNINFGTYFTSNNVGVRIDVNGVSVTPPATNTIFYYFQTNTIGNPANLQSFTFGPYNNGATLSFKVAVGSCYGFFIP